MKLREFLNAHVMIENENEIRVFGEKNLMSDRKILCYLHLFFVFEEKKYFFRFICDFLDDFVLTLLLIIFNIRC